MWAHRGTKLTTECAAASPLSFPQRSTPEERCGRKSSLNAEGAPANQSQLMCGNGLDVITGATSSPEGVPVIAFNGLFFFWTIKSMPVCPLGARLSSLCLYVLSVPVCHSLCVCPVCVCSQC